MNKAKGCLFFLLLLAGWFSICAAEEKPLRDPAWDYYLKSQKQVQVAYHHLVRLHLHDLRDTIKQSQDLQLALADQQGERFYFLMKNYPDRIRRTEGFSAFVNFPWSPEDEKQLLAENKSFQKTEKRIDKLRNKLNNSPDYQRILDKLGALSGHVEYQKIHSRFRFVPQNVETLLSGQPLAEAESSF